MKTKIFTNRVLQISTIAGFVANIKSPHSTLTRILYLCYVLKSISLLILLIVAWDCTLQFIKCKVCFTDNWGNYASQKVQQTPP